MWIPDLKIILFAILLDLVIGDPRKLPHLTRLMGWNIKQQERIYRGLKLDGIFGGLLFYFTEVISIIVPIAIIHWAISTISPIASSVLEVYLIHQCIAFRDLIAHVKEIIKPLKKNDLLHARKRLGWIVGRDTEDLDENEINRATIEAISESFNDGVISPLFWTLLFGPAGAIIYRITNTLDSMVGHRDEQYEKFGKISARMDDLMGYLPARLTAIMIWVTRPKSPIRTIWREAKHHSSLNAGYPESSMAYVLNVRLGGTSFYDGEKHDGPIFNKNGAIPETKDSVTSIRILNVNYYILTFLLTLIVILP